MIIAVALGGVALLIAATAVVFLAVVRKRLTLLQGRAGEKDILEAVAQQVEEVRGLRGDIRQLDQNVQVLAQTIQGAIQRFSVYRYDAFEDMGGKMSFSAAFLNDKGDGVVISCINGRQEARTYAKPVAAARSDYNLSPEEEEAIRRALSGQVT